MCSYFISAWVGANTMAANGGLSSAREETWKSKVRKFIFHRVPILAWIQNYTKEDAFSDLIAGITISLTMVPQSIAYAALANLPPQYGLNSAFMGCFIYVFFGTSKEVIIGPSSLMALLTYEYTRELNVDFVILLCFLCGIVELLMGVLRLGFIVEFISAPVVSGFTSAISIIIIVSQTKGLLGVHFKSQGFVDNVRHLISNIGDTQPSDLILGSGCLAFLLVLRKLKDISLPEKTPHKNIVKRILWFITTGRNALTVCLCCGISAAYLNSGVQPPFVVTKAVDSGLPKLHFPPTSSQVGNVTYNFVEMTRELGSGPLIIPVLSVLANVAIAKSFSEGAVDGTQEMITLALANICGSFVQSMPTAGAFTRSAIISASGVRTCLAGLYSAIVTLIALLFLAPYFHLIPRATLSAILIAAIMFLIDVDIFRPLWRHSKLDLVCHILTIFSCLYFGVEVGLLVGMALGLGQLIYFWARPKSDVEICTREYGSFVLITPKSGMYFPSVDHVCELIAKAALKKGQSTMPVVINCVHFIGVDYTAAKRFSAINDIFEKRGQRLLFMDVDEEIKSNWKGGEWSHLEFCSSQDLEESIFGENLEMYKVKTDAKGEKSLDKSETLELVAH